MKLRTRVSVAALAVASVVGGAAAGVILSGPSPAIAQEAEGDSSIAPATPTTIEDVLAGLVADGVLTQEQADAVAEALEDARPVRDVRRHRGHFFGGAIDEVATLFGMTADELGTELRAGSSLADIAAANGVDVQDVVDVLVAAAEERLDEAVADGHLSEDEAAERAADIEERITDMVNGDLEFEGRRGFGGHGRRGPAPEADSSATDTSFDA